MRGVFKKFSQFILVFALTVSWIFSGYPQVFNFPPEVQKTHALSLSTLSLGTYADISSTAINGTEPVLQVIASTNDSTYVYDNINSTHTGTASFELANTPSDFGNMDTAFVRLRYAVSGTQNNNTWNSLTAQIVQSDGSTALSNEVTIASNITTQTPTNSGTITLTGLNTTADKTIWDGALVLIRWSISRTKGGDSAQERVFAAEVTGTYTIINNSPTVALNSPADMATGQSATPTLNFTGTDTESDNVEYEVQVDTASTFDSSTANMDSYSESNQDTDLILDSGADTASARSQSFTGNGTSISTVKLYLKKTGSPTGNATVKIYAHSGTFGTDSVLTGTALATATALDVSTLTTSYQLITFDFPTPYATVNGTKYVVVIEYGAGSFGSNYVNVGGDSSSPSHGGNEAFFTTIWFPEPGVDLVFYVTSGGPLLDKFSAVPDAGFTAGHPFTSGTAIDYTVQAGDSLSGGIHHWRVRAIDPTGSNTYGAWSSTRSFSVSASPVYSITITSSGTIEYGFVGLGVATSTVGNGYTQTAQNDGNTAEKLNVKSSDATGGTSWALASSIGTNQFKHEFSTTTGSTWTTMTAADTYVTATPSVAQSGTVDFDFRLTTPSSSSDYVQKSITITIQAVAP